MSQTAGTDFPHFPPPPRAIRKHSGAKSLASSRFVLILYILCALGLAMAAGRDAVVRFGGTPVTAQVTRKWQSQGRRSSFYHIGYRYQADGRWVEDQDQISEQAYTRLSNNESVPANTANLLGFRTAELMLGSEAYWSERAALPIAGVFVCFGISFLVWQSCTIPAREKRLLKTGNVTTGQIVKTREVRGKHTSYYATFAYLPFDPCESIQRKMQISKRAFDGCTEGMDVTVFYDPLKPSHAVAYELSDFVIMGD